MKITFAEAAKADIAAFIADEGAGLPGSAEALDKATGGLISEAMDGGRFDGKTGQLVSAVLPKGADARRAVIVGGGKPKKRDARAMENIGAHFVKGFASSGFKSASIAAHTAEEAARVAAERGHKVTSVGGQQNLSSRRDIQRQAIQCQYQQQ